MIPHAVLLKSHLGKQGGLEKYALRIAQGFLEKGFKVSLLSKIPCSIQGVSVHTMNTCSWPAFRRMEQYDLLVQKWLKEHKTDLIFGMDRNRMQTHIRAGNGVHASFLESRIHTEGKFKWLACKLNPLHRKILQLEKASFEYLGLKTIFANSHMVQKELLQFYRIDPAKIQVVHNGVEWHEMEIDFLSRQEQKKIHMQRLGLDPSRFYFLFIGNGYLRKGLTQLLKAFAKIRYGDAHLLVVGKENKSNNYQSLAANLGLKNHVSFFGKQQDTRPFYQIADSLVIPSFYDPFANVTLEALAMGLFVVSSRWNGGHEVLTAANGTIIENLLDIDSVASSLEEALRRPKTESQATLIRNSVRHLDFSHQIPKLIHV